MMPVYFIEAKGADRIKIGFATDPRTRGGIIGAGKHTFCPFPIEVIRIISGDRKVERAWHRRFDHLRAHGEWFDADDELREAIEKEEGIIEIDLRHYPAEERARIEELRLIKAEKRGKASRRMHAALTPEQRSENARRVNASRTPEQRKEISRKANAAITPEQRSERMRKVSATLTSEQRSSSRMTKLTSEQRKEISRKARAAITITPEQRSENGRKFQASRTPEQRSESARKAGKASAAARTPEQRSESARKAGRVGNASRWATHHRRMAEAQTTNNL
jgi:hypothetical protein